MQEGSPETSGFGQNLERHPNICQERKSADETHRHVNLPRARDAFRVLFRRVQSFYSVTFEQDVTKLYAYTHEKGLSFYHAMSYLVTKAMNQVQMFRYVVKDGVIYEIDGRTPSLTELRKGEEQYYCVNVPFVDDMAAFCAEAAKRRDSQHEFMKAAERRAICCSSPVCRGWKSPG